MNSYKSKKTTPINNSKKYVVYKNDLKFSEFIDPEMSIWDKDVEKKYHSNVYKLLKYRIYDCKKNNFEYLDISYLNLDKLPNFTEHKYYNNLKKIKYLFVHNNNISDIGNSLDIFENLEVLDISNNKLTSINSLPDTLKELVCHNNKLIKICTSDSVTILDCSFNSLTKLQNYPMLHTLMCEDNNIDFLRSFFNIKHITCKNNPITKISDQPILEFLNCENTKIQGRISEMPYLEWLICHDTNINDIATLKSLKHIEMTNCTLLTFPYIQSLCDILCDLNAELLLNSKYKLKHYIVERNYVYYVF